MVSHDIRDADWKDIHSRSAAAGYNPEVLFSSTVAIVGVGALGQNVALNLALAGVGNLLLIDFDDFEPHNATRSPLYPPTSLIEKIGLGKARCVAEGLARHCTASSPSVRYSNTRAQMVPHRTLAAADVIVSAVDSQGARAYLSEFGRLYSVPVVEGGFSGAQISMTVDHGTGVDPCYRCTNPVATGSFSCTQYALRAETANIIPAIQNAAAVLGGLVGEATIELLHGTRPPGFRKVFGSIRDARIHELVVSRDLTCPGLHIDRLPILPVAGAEDLSELLDRIPRQYDQVRFLEPFVVEMSCRKCGAALRPLVTQTKWQLRPYCSDCDTHAIYEQSRIVPFFPLEYKTFTRDDVSEMQLDSIALDAFNLSDDSRLLVESNEAGGLIVEFE